MDEAITVEIAYIISFCGLLHEIKTHLLPLLQVLPGSFLGLLGGLSVTLAGLQSLLLGLLLVCLILLLLVFELLLFSSAQWLCGTTCSSTLLGASSSLLLGLDPLDSRVVGEDIVHELTETSAVVLLSPSTLRLVLLLGESLLVSPSMSVVYSQG